MLHRKADLFVEAQHTHKLTLLSSCAEAMNAPKKLAILDVLKVCRRMAKQKRINKEAARQGSLL